MMRIDEIIDDVVFISFREPETLKDIGLTVKSGNFLVNGFDQFGLWLSHPGLYIVEETDEKGKPIPTEKQNRQQITANFLLRWEKIETIMHFPGREGYDFPNEFEKDFGFEIKSKRQAT